MVIVDPQFILNAKPCVVTDEIWGDVREDGKDKLVREFENCESGMEQISVRSRELIRELVLKLVWGANLVKNVDVFSRQQPMVL